VSSLTRTQFSIGGRWTVWRNALDLQELLRATILTVVAANNGEAEASRRFCEMRLDKLAT